MGAQKEIGRIAPRKFWPRSVVFLKIWTLSPYVENKIKDF